MRSECVVTRDDFIIHSHAQDFPFGYAQHLEKLMNRCAGTDLDLDEWCVA